MPVRRKSDFPTKNKKILLKMPECDFLQLKDIVSKYNLVYLDVIKKGIECVIDNTIKYNTASSSDKDKTLCIRVTEEEAKYIKNISKKYNLTYFDIISFGLEYYKRL